MEADGSFSIKSWSEVYFSKRLTQKSYCLGRCVVRKGKNRVVGVVVPCVRVKNASLGLSYIFQN